MSERETEWADGIRKALGGDEAAYRKLLQALTVFVRVEARRGFARYGRGTSDVEDVVQETLLAIHLKRSTWRTNELFIPWVRAIGRNKLIDCMRRGGRRINVPIENVIDILPAVEPEEHLTEKTAEEVLGLLKGRQRDIVEQISIKGTSIRETASLFTMTEVAVRVALHRGLASLSKAYRTQET